MLHGVGVRVPSSALVKISNSLEFFCENSSAGRAQPCQGWGRGFESRFSLNNKPRPGGGIGRHAGLKILCPQGRTGSSPVWGTLNPLNREISEGFLFLGWSKEWILNAKFFKRT